MNWSCIGLDMRTQQAILIETLNIIIGSKERDNQHERDLQVRMEMKMGGQGFEQQQLGMVGREW